MESKGRAGSQIRRAQLKEDSKGRTIRMYNWYATPRETLRQTPAVAGSLNLKDDLTIGQMEQRAGARSDDGAVIKMQDAGGERKTVWKLRRQESGMTAKGLQKCRARGQRGKPKTGFPSPVVREQHRQNAI
jgi:hypothetical protein